MNHGMIRTYPPHTDSPTVISSFTSLGYLNAAHGYKVECSLAHVKYFSHIRLTRCESAVVFFDPESIRKEFWAWASVSSLTAKSPQCS